jgi:hypothetical protein
LVVPGRFGARQAIGVRSMVAPMACLILACGADEPTRVTRAQGPPPPQFVLPPLVYASSKGSLDVWVRLDRPLRDNEGALAEYPPWGAGIEVPGAQEDIPGLARDDVHPTCYSQHLYGDIEPGEDVTVTLVLSETVRITATARAQASEPPHYGQEGLRQMDCPADSATLRCSGTVTATHLLGIGVRSATNTSCRRARAVMRSVGRWANSTRCYEKLCVTGHRMNRGFRCDAELVGEAAWQITCVRGKRVVRGYTSE